MQRQQALMLLVITAGAFVVPLISERIGWFTAPSEMLYGALVAALLPTARQPGEFIVALSQFGFLLLLFLAGLEVDFTLMRRRGRGVFVRSIIAALGLQALALGLVIAMGWPLINALLIGALSVSLLLVVLNECHLTQTEFGQTLLIVGAIGEFCSIFAVTAYDLVARYGLSWMLAVAALKLLALLLAGYAALRGLSRAASDRPGRFSRLFAVRDGQELGVRAALAFMLCFAAAAVLLQVEQILATFIAGMVCSYAFRGEHIVTKKLTTLGQGFFLPVFFISVGLNLQIRNVLHGPALRILAGVLVGLLLVRLAAIPLLIFAGMALRRALPGALLLGTPLTLLVAISQVGISLGQLNPDAYSAVLGAAIVSAVVFPLLARVLLPHAERMPAPVSRPRRWSSAFGPRPRTISGTLIAPSADFVVESEVP